MADKVVLLRDRSWPETSGVCCWRHCLREAFRTCGVEVDDAEIQPVVIGVYGPAGTGRAARLPRAIRRPAAMAYRRGRQLVRDLRARRSQVADQHLAQRLNQVGVVVAESVGAAEAALAAGVRGDRLWVLALPPERLYAGVHTGYAGRIARLAPLLRGFLTDSESSRDSVERVAAGRPRVEIFAPLAADRACPSCGMSAARSAPSGTYPAGGPSDAAQLALSGWPGSSGRSAPDARLSWTQDSEETPPRVAAVEDLKLRTAASQEAAAGRVLGATLAIASGRPRRTTLISGYDLKFVREIAARLDQRDDLDVTLDAWPSLSRHSRQTERKLAEADVVVAEWARPSAVWLSRHKRPGQFLVVRLHRYELDCAYPRDIDIDQVDAVVHVSPPIGGRIRAELGWPAEKLVYIPNYVDTDWLDRPKLPGARFGIGFVGMEFQNKRFDLALDVLAAVRARDPRFTLQVRSAMPWDNVYAWARDAEREYLGWCMDRVERDPLLRGGMRFDSPGRDMARWYRQVGHVLSMSDIESFHLSAAEGMASGAVAVIRPWPGAQEIYGAEWIEPSVEAAAQSILAAADPQVWTERAARARAEIRRSADPAAAVAAWADLLHGDVVAARRRFAAYTP